MKRLWVVIVAMALSAMALSVTAVSDRAVLLGWVIQGGEHHGITVRYRDNNVEGHVSWFGGDDPAVLLGLGAVASDDIFGGDYYTSLAAGTSVVLNKSPVFDSKFAPYWRVDQGYWAGGDTGFEASFGHYWPKAGRTHVWGLGVISDLGGDDKKPVVRNAHKPDPNPDPDPEPEPEPEPDPDDDDCKRGYGYGDKNNCHEFD